MLLEQINRPVASTGVMQTAKATIKATPKIFSFFADQIYSNKPLAICRELAANAIDAHTAAGKGDIPIEVWLPTDLDPAFRVRDHGIGMSHDFVMGPFMAYTDGSTKDASNDQIGGFGIGSKSPFDYTDQFTLRSVYNGTVSVYAMFMDEDGIPSVGLLGQSPTDESNGVEVSFPVRTEDFGKFANAANEALKYFDPLPIVYNGVIDAPDYMAKGNGWAMRRESGKLAVIMGGVRYEVTPYNLDYDLRYDDKLKHLLEYGLDLRVPIGTCGVALSREGLSYTPHTNAGIRAALEAALDEIIESFSTMFDQYPTEFEAKQALWAECPAHGSHSARGQLLLGNAQYRGQPLTPGVKIEGQHWEIDRYRSRKHAITNANWEFFHAKSDGIRFDNYECIILDDLPQSPKFAAISRIKTYVSNHCSRDKPTLVLREPQFAIAVPDDLFVRTSNLPEPPKKPRAPKGDRPKVRMFKLDGSHRAFRPSRNSSYTYGSQEIDYFHQPASGILVVCDNFEVPYSTWQKLQTGLVPFEACYFVNRSDGEKLKKGWTLFDAEFDRRLQQLLRNTPELPARLALRKDDHLTDLFYRLAHVKPDDVKKNSVAFKIINLREKYIAPLTNMEANLAPYVKAALPPRLNPEQIAADFNARHPKAARFLELTGRLTKTFDVQIFKELL